MIGEGLRAAIERGDEVRLITLTDPPAHPLLAKALSEALDRLTSLLGKGGPAPVRPSKGSGDRAQKAWRKKCRRRAPLIQRWIAIVEVAPRSRRVHVHLLVTGPYIPQGLLASCVRTAGFGSIFDVRLVETEHDVEETVARLATYLSKSNPAEGLLRRGATRVRPIHQGRKERSWYPGGLRYAEEQLGIRGPVPLIPRREGWFRAILSPAGAVLKVSPLKGTANQPLAGGGAPS
jgi:hypothetical protein